MAMFSNEHRASDACRVETFSSYSSTAESISAQHKFQLHSFLLFWVQIQILSWKMTCSMNITSCSPLHITSWILKELFEPTSFVVCIVKLLVVNIFRNLFVFWPYTWKQWKCSVWYCSKQLYSFLCCTCFLVLLSCAVLMVFTHVMGALNTYSTHVCQRLWLNDRTGWAGHHVRTEATGCRVSSPLLLSCPALWMW